MTMSKFRNVNTLIAASAIIFFSACSSTTSADKDMTKPEGIKAIKEKVVKSFGADKKVYSLSFSAADHLSNEAGSATIHYLENGKDMSQTLTLSPEEKLQNAEPALVQNEFLLSKKQGSIAVKDLNFDKIPEKLNEAFKLISDEYEGATLHNWNFDVDNSNKLSENFTIEVSKVGESSERKGRMVISNYYEFGFELDESGKVKARD